MGMGSLKLDGKTVIVTGATGILGRSHSWALAREGANLIISDIRKEECDLLAAEIADSTNVKTFLVMSI